MSTFKKIQVVMLPTNEKANALWWSGHKLYIKSPEDFTRGELNHLYFLSDEKPREGDYGLLFPTKSEPFLFKHDGSPKAKISALAVGTKKVIASTEKLRVIGKDLFGGIEAQHLQNPSQSFIEAYIKAWNEGNPITEVMVEYWDNSDYNPSIFDDVRLKVNPRDNTITIRKVKDSWNREEVVALLHKRMRYTFGLDYDETITNKWIEENL